MSSRFSGLSKSRVMGTSVAATVLPCVMATVMASHSADARSLDAASCQSLLAEQKVMERDGVKAQIERGPEWAKDNLDDVGIRRIRTYIALEEQILFRCPAGFKNAVVVAIRRGKRPSGVLPPLPLKISGSGLRPPPPPPSQVSSGVSAVGRTTIVVGGVPVPERNRWKRAVTLRIGGVPLPVRRPSQGN
ncbi:MAG: hypothetical protein AAF732_19860 [Pseudomonadota bacterium]